jgi:hypothetical protein
VTGDDRAKRDRFRRAIAAIDAANAEDPHRITLRGRELPRELAHGELATEWLERLVEAPGELLRLAVRAHHLQRWRSPRSDHPAGRPGYLRWRRDLQRRHAEDVARILEAVGYAPEEIARVQAIVQKRGLGADAEVQAFEDALCLVFLETRLESFAGEHPPEKALDVLHKTLRKMSPAARAHARSLALPDGVRALVAEAADHAG